MDSYLYYTYIFFYSYLANDDQTNKQNLKLWNNNFGAP